VSSILENVIYKEILRALIYKKLVTLHEGARRSKKARQFVTKGGVETMCAVTYFMCLSYAEILLSLCYDL